MTPDGKTLSPEPMLTNHQRRCLHLEAISQELSLIIRNMCSEITFLKLPPHLPGANELTFVWRHPNVNLDDTGPVLSWSSVRRVHVCVMNQFWYTVDPIKAQSTSLIIYGNRVIYVRSTCQGNIIIMIMVRCMKINNHKNWLWVCDQIIVLR